MNPIIFRITESVGNSTMSMRKVLSVSNFSSKGDALAAIPANMTARDTNTIDVDQPYIALTIVENGCVHSCLDFYQ